MCAVGLRMTVCCERCHKSRIERGVCVCVRARVTHAMSQKIPTIPHYVLWQLRTISLHWRLSCEPNNRQQPDEIQLLPSIRRCFEILY